MQSARPLTRNPPSPDPASINTNPPRRHGPRPPYGGTVTNGGGGCWNYRFLGCGHRGSHKCQGQLFAVEQAHLLNVGPARAKTGGPSRSPGVLGTRGSTVFSAVPSETQQAADIGPASRNRKE